MPENKIKNTSSEQESPKPKRRIVRRIVRRIPKKAISNDVIETKIPLREARQTIIKDHEIIADETPVTPSIEDTVVKDEDESYSNPKDMILKQLSHSREKSSKIENTEDNIWPYANIPHQRRNRIDSDDEEAEEEFENNKKYFSWIPWVIIPLTVTGIVIFALSYFAGAEVLITPTKVDIPAISADIITEKDVDESKLTPLSVLIIEEKVSVDTQASEAKTTIATASGKVTIFNKQKVAQTLIKTTRLESEDGKIYRIRENIKIPAMNGDKPGSIDVMVYAESAGPDYNKKSGTDFTVPGFKGKPQFTQVYAKSITEITGGSSGVKKTVSKEVMDELSKSMRIELENKLRARVEREILQKQVSYESLYQFDYKEPQLEASDAPEKAKVSLSGTLSLPVFDRSILSRELAKASVKDYAGENITLDSLERLSVKITDDQKVNLLTDKKISFHFEGSGKFIWIVDVDAFTKALLNISKGDIKRVSSRFTGIENVSTKINPFWKSYMPGNTKDIKVKIVE